jgi:hypothetical protein
MAGGMPHDLLMRSVKLMGEEVLPAVHEAKRPEGLAQSLSEGEGPSLQHAQARVPSE